MQGLQGQGLQGLGLQGSLRALQGPLQGLGLQGPGAGAAGPGGCRAWGHIFGSLNLENGGVPSKFIEVRCIATDCMRLSNTKLQIRHMMLPAAAPRKQLSIQATWTRTTHKKTEQETSGNLTLRLWLLVWWIRVRLKFNAKDHHIFAEIFAHVALSPCSIIIPRFSNKATDRNSKLPHGLRYMMMPTAHSWGMAATDASNRMHSPSGSAWYAIS